MNWTERKGWQGHHYWIGEIDDVRVFVYHSGDADVYFKGDAVWITALTFDTPFEAMHEIEGALE